MKDDEIFSNFIETRYNYDLTRMHRIVSQSKVQISIIFTVYAGFISYNFDIENPIKITYLISVVFLSIFVLFSAKIVFMNNTENIKTSSKLLKEIENEKTNGFSLLKSINIVMIKALDEISVEIKKLNKENVLMILFGMLMVLFMAF